MSGDGGVVVALDPSVEAIDQGTIVGLVGDTEGRRVIVWMDRRYAAMAWSALQKSGALDVEADSWQVTNLLKV